MFTAYPGIFLHAGLLHDFHYPACGCDACDSNWVAEADGLEQQVLAVVTGHYREGIERGLRPWSSTRSPTLTAGLQGDLAPKTSPQSDSNRPSPSSETSLKGGPPGHTQPQTHAERRVTVGDEMPCTPCAIDGMPRLCYFQGSPAGTAVPWWDSNCHRPSDRSHSDIRLARRGPSASSSLT